VTSTILPFKKTGCFPFPNNPDRGAAFEEANWP
jgi:hypothetical protein